MPRLLIGTKTRLVHGVKFLFCEAAGMYDNENSALPEDVIHRILFERGHPVLAKVAKRKGLPYPPLDGEGQIVADEAWWKEMQKK